MCSMVCMYKATQCKQSLFVHDLHLKQYSNSVNVHKQAYNHTVLILRVPYNIKFKCMKYSNILPTKKGIPDLVQFLGLHKSHT